MVITCTVVAASSEVLPGRQDRHQMSSIINCHLFGGLLILAHNLADRKESVKVVDVWLRER